MRVLLLFLSLLAVAPRAAHAFGRTESRETYSDPRSTISDFFKADVRADRKAIDDRDWPTVADLDKASESLLTELGTNQALKKCRWEESCETGTMVRWLNWDLWLSLNRDAAQAWTMLVQCQRGDLEKARQAYYRAKDFCPDDKAANAELSDRLMALHGHFRDFIASTSVRWIDSLSDHERLLALSRTLPMHPMLAQVMIETASTIVRFLAPNGHDFGGNIIRPSIWIDPHYNRTFGQRAQEVISNPERSNDAAHATARAYVNSMLLLMLLPRTEENDYHRWGLWEDASTLVTILMSNQMQISFGFANDHRDVAYLAYSAFHSGLSGERYKIQILDSLNQGGPSIVTEFRAMAERYGTQTYRANQCASRFMDYRFCFAVDPSNPQEDFSAY